ncbi:TetR/AcrR family transcriptional regulator [Nocardioides sp. KIGAM211]|uniref:TetR/AcrR family transcriptional regulator n=1 Tax=Nocardioides luti TaxID=2761101 RepID=A0A7X0RIA8_9ACTN|nr:TetR/AcrR family transcriptional regulator [Nocardioides luti]MBB6627574.1 TetR/AcrR family transcriptional regulator [Nocardioides luti]
MSSASRLGIEAVRDVRRLKRDDTKRERMLSQLEEIFLAEGFSALTTDELCKRLRCSKSTLYGVAGSREQINQAVVRHFFARSTEAIEADVSSATDPGTRILEYLAGVGKAMNRNSPSFYADMVSYPPTAEIYRLNSRAASRRVQAMIEDGVGAGVFRSADAALASLTVAHLMDGVQSGEVLEATGLSAGEAFAELGELLVHGLAIRNRRS